jgi:Family of unknown function (DUF5678)
MSELTFEKKLQKLESFDRDLNWLDKRPQNFRKKYGGKYIAIKDNRVVAQDRQLRSLLRKLRSDHYDTHSMVIKYLSDQKIKYAV